MCAPSAELDLFLLVNVSHCDSLCGFVKSYWANFWNRILDHDVDQVLQILDQVPPIPAYDPVISLEELQQQLRKLRLGKARGPDGFSNGELRNLPLVGKELLLKLLNAFTTHRMWPPELLKATVTLLPKSDGTAMVSDTRPITVLSTLFRLWSKCQASKFARNALAFLSSSIVGNVPRSSSKWLATYLQFSLEKAHVTGTDYVICSLDLVKAFNTLQRPILEALNSHFGVPEDTWESYHFLLSNVQRHFKIVGSLSPQMPPPEAGVPEGCAVAVQQMLMVNWGVSLAIQASQQESSISFHSYVDNWLHHGVLLSSVQTMAQRAISLQSVFGFSVSPSKTWISAVLPQSRATLDGWSPQQTPVRVPTHCLELGFALHFSRKLSTKDMQDRLLSGRARLERLTNQQWPVPVKISFLVGGIFPQIFSGCEVQHFSQSVLQSLRGAFNSAVHGKKSKASHYMAPLFSGRIAYEPLLYMLQARLRTFRAMNASFTPDLLTVWNLIYELPLLSSPHLVSGPVACLAHSLLSLGFTLAPDLCARGIHADQLHLLWSPLSHWTQEAEATWLHQAVSKEPRSVWQGSQPCFPLWKSMCASHKELPPLSLSFRVGKLLSASALANIRGSTHSDCEFCGSSTSDTRHLFDECPAFSQTRDNHGYSDFCNAPLLTRCTGIPSFCAPPALDMPVEGPNLANVPVGLPFFTDGSALSPDLPVIRAASWSIVVALPDGTFFFGLPGASPGERPNHRAG